MNDTSLVSVVIPVYRDATRAREAVTASLSQALATGMSLEVVVVDDGSGDGTAEQLSRIDDPRVRLLALQENFGRSAARNAGAAEARGAFVVFMDCDCLPVGNGFIGAHLQALQENAVASTGHVTGDGTTFWSLYQTQASMRRERQHAAGAIYAGSSQNLAVRTAAFVAIGGFDINYRHYGFEDRDLLIRLGEQGHIAWIADAQVRHMDALTLREVSRKMFEGGRHTSARFADQHPEAYRALGYASLDARLHKWLRPAGILANPIARIAALGIDRSELLERLPYPAARSIAKGVSALAFLAGTSTPTNS